MKSGEIDAIILRDLLKDGRRNFVDIAKECGVSKNTIWKHYGALKKAGIIVGATIQMDYRSFGYNAVANLLVNVESQQTDQVVECIQKMPKIHAAYRVNGKHNLRVIAILRNLNELEHIKEAIKRYNAVLDIRTYIWTDVKNIPENLAIGPFQKSTSRIHEKESFGKSNIQKTANKIDEIDMQIVEKLSENGRTSFKKIAEEIGTSTDTVIKRYRKLQETGIVKAIIQIDPTKMGYHAILNLGIATSQHNSVPISKSLAEIPDVVVITKTSGDYDIYATVLVRNIEQLLAIHDEIARIPNISRIDADIGRSITVWPTPRQYISTFN